MDCVSFTVIIDDIVLPDGETCMQQLGGGGPQTLFGYQLVSTLMHNRRASLGISAGVGSDLPSMAATAWLEGLNCCLTGLEVHDERGTPRAWQVFKLDGRRTQIWRVEDDEELFTMLRPRSFESLPLSLRTARSYHIGIHPLHPPLDLLKDLRKAAHLNGGLLSLEPYTSAERALAKDEIELLVGNCDIFSPNHKEAESILGLKSSSPHDLINALVASTKESGARAIVIRRDASGVVASSRETSFEQHLILPAVEETNVVDVTGCGNAFCGGFLASYADSPSILDACVAGSVAASFMAEEQGVPKRPIEEMRSSADSRFQALKSRHQVVARSTRRGSLLVHVGLIRVPLESRGAIHTFKR